MKHVFIVGLDPFNHEKLKALPEAKDVEFHAALHYHEMRDVDELDVEALLEKCYQRIDEFGKIDGIASYFDFPGTLMVPIIAEKYNLPGTSFESVAKCEHKYWSRLEQSKVIEEHIPDFRSFNPFDKEAYQKINLLPPFWIKPIKSFRSFLAYKINGEGLFYDAMEEVQKHIEHISAPFSKLMKTHNLPAEIADMEDTCIAEGTITGFQCTVEGYVYNGNVVVYGIVDSVREGDRSSFGRYEYPSILPQEIQFRMADVTRRAISQLGLNNAPFNVEYFYNQTADEVYLLEVNPRISQSHADIFEKVHGSSHHSIMVNLALGRKPKTLEHRGEFNRAANFMIRTFQDGTVKKTPTKDEIKILKKFIPGLEVKISVTEGTVLSEMENQDSYSYELANVFIGARDQRELVEKYHQCIDGLTFDIDYKEEQMIH